MRREPGKEKHLLGGMKLAAALLSCQGGVLNVKRKMEGREKEEEEGERKKKKERRVMKL